jgi:hypothetical protein
VLRVRPVIDHDVLPSEMTCLHGAPMPALRWRTELLGAAEAARRDDVLGDRLGAAPAPPTGSSAGLNPAPRSGPERLNSCPRRASALGRRLRHRQCRVWVGHCRPRTSGLRSPKLKGSFPEVRSITLLSQPDPTQSFVQAQSGTMSSEQRSATSRCLPCRQVPIPPDRSGAQTSRHQGSDGERDPTGHGN